MPVHRRKKDTTPNTPGSTQEQPATPLPDQQAFHQQHLRELARAGIRVMLEGVMREELDTLIGVAWGESSPKRKGYRNGSYLCEPSEVFGIVVTISRFSCTARV
jgi:putative transposase